jgi:hypothetical protein
MAQRVERRRDHRRARQRRQQIAVEHRDHGLIAAAADHQMVRAPAVVEHDDV